MEAAALSKVSLRPPLFAAVLAEAFSQITKEASIVKVHGLTISLSR